MDDGTGEQHLDMFTFFASSAPGMNHPGVGRSHADGRRIDVQIFENAFVTGLPERLATCVIRKQAWMATASGS